MTSFVVDVVEVGHVKAQWDRERRRYPFKDVPRPPLPAPGRVERYVGRGFFAGASESIDLPLEQGDPS